MMNVFKSMFGVCSGSAEKGEVHDTIKRVFGNDMVLKDNGDRQSQRSKYINHVREALPKMLEAKSTQKPKSSKKHVPIVIDANETTDDRTGRIGPKLVVFDASTGTGRLVLVGDERVSVQGMSSFATIRATACVYSAKWMYEVQLGTKGIMQIGWCTSSCMFSMDTGVGDTAHSYAYDGSRVRKWNVATSAYGQPWLSGDVIGACIDLDRGLMEYYRNGVSLGVAFDKVTHGSGLAYFPAVSLAMQEHLYANFGHVPFVFPVEGFAPIQAPPTRECTKSALLFKSLDALVDELSRPSDLKPSVTAKTSKVKSETSRVQEEEVALRIHSSQSAYSPRPSPHCIVDAQSSEFKKMSKRAFLMSLARIVVLELGTVLRLSYVVVAELLPRLRGALGFRSRSIQVDHQAAEYYASCRDEGFIGLSSKLLSQPQPRLCLLLDLLWTFLDESALCDAFEHCVVRECLLYELVSPDIYFNQQTEGVYSLCGLMQHTETRHHLIKYVFFNKITFHENGIKNGVLFSSDLHVTGDLVMAKADIYEPLFAHMTMDIQGVQTNITYSWDVEKKKDNEYYISLGQERIAIRNGRLPTFFLQPRASADTKIIDKTLQLKNSIVDHFSEEITAAAMRTVMDNIRLFAHTVPVKYYYKLF